MACEYSPCRWSSVITRRRSERIGGNGNPDKQLAGNQQESKNDASDGSGAGRPHALTDQGAFFVHPFLQRQ
jgi:hypothetical protein